MRDLRRRAPPPSNAYGERRPPKKFHGEHAVIEDGGRVVRGTSNRVWSWARVGGGFSDGVHSWLLQVRSAGALRHACSRTCRSWQHMLSMSVCLLKLWAARRHGDEAQLPVDPASMLWLYCVPPTLSSAKPTIRRLKRSQYILVELR